MEVEHLIRRGSNHAPLYALCSLEVNNIVKPSDFCILVQAQRFQAFGQYLLAC